MGNILIFFILLTTFHFIKAQSIGASLVQVYTHTNAVTPIVKGKDNFENTSRTLSFSYEHFLYHRKHSVILSYTKFKGCTIIYFEPGGVIAGGGALLAKGFCAGVDINRVDLSGSYLLTKQHRIWYFKPFAGIGVQWSRKTGWEYWSDGLPINGPYYFELEPMIAEPMNTTQIVPSLGFRTGFVFWKRLDLGLGIQGVYAFKPYQKMYLKYQYKGEVQPMAEYESTGTGLFVTLGVGYRFAKLIK